MLRRRQLPQISRAKLLEFFASQPACLVAMEARGGAHYLAREITKFGHEVRLIAQIRSAVPLHASGGCDMV